MPKRHLLATLALVIAATCGFAAPASARNSHADKDHGGQPGEITIVADNLNNPRQIAIHGGAIYVAARHEELEGDYVLAMYMDRDQPIIFGRELFGEPKKQAVSRLQRRGPHMSGWVMRDGVRLIEIEAELTDESGPEQMEGLNFNYKATPSCDGIGLEDDAVLTVATFASELTLIRTGTGTLTLRSTANDPLGEIEIVSVLGASYVEGDLITSCRAAARIPADAFLPYALGRMDDWSVLDTEAVRSVVA